MRRPPPRFPLLGVSARFVVGGLALMAVAVVEVLSTRDRSSGPWFSLGFWAVIGGLLLPLAYDWIRGRTEGEDRALMARDLADMLDLGAPLDEALDALGADLGSRKGTQYSRPLMALPFLADQLRAGTAFSEALARSRWYPPHWVQLVAVGERLENLPRVLRGLAQAEPQRPAGFQWTLLYLGVVIFTVAVVGHFLTTYILPTFRALMAGLHIPAALDLPHRAFFGMLELGVVGAGVLLLIPATRRLLVQVGATAVGFRPVLRLRQQAESASTLAAALELGLSEAEAFDLAARTAELPEYRRVFARAARGAGATLAAELAREPRLFAPPLVWLARQGERFGNLPEALLAGADALRDEADGRATRALRLAEVVAVACVGLLVFLLVLATMLPLAQLLGTLLEEVYLP